MAVEIAKKMANVFMKYAHGTNYMRKSVPTKDVFRTALLQACHAQFCHFLKLLKSNYSELVKSC